MEPSARDVHASLVQTQCTLRCTRASTSMRNRLPPAFPLGPLWRTSGSKKKMVIGPEGGKAEWRKANDACPSHLCLGVHLSLLCFPFCCLKHSLSCQSRSSVGKPSSRRLYANTLKSEQIAGDVCFGSCGCVWPVAFQLQSTH